MKALVAGGGVGGLAAAIALRRKGFEVEVLERAPAYSPVGASLILGPNAVRLLDEFGLGDHLRRSGVCPDTAELLRWDDGSLLHRTELGPRIEERFGAPQLDFFRPDLLGILADAVPVGSLHLGAEVVEVFQDDLGAGVRLADGTRLEGDVVVAADGVRSPLRGQLIGPEDPVFSGTVVYRGVARRADVEHLHALGRDLYWLGPQRHGVSYWLSGGELLAVTLAVRDADVAQESWTLETDVGEPLSLVGGWDAGFLERLRSCPSTLRSAVYVRRPLEHWSFGRVTLLGDAAHAMEPFQAQGASQAVEDAFVLAACLADSEGDVPGALRRYEQIRMSRATELQASASSAADNFYLDDGPEQRARDAAYAELEKTQPWGPREPLWDYDVREILASLS